MVAKYLSKKGKGSKEEKEKESRDKTRKSRKMKTPVMAGELELDVTIDEEQERHFAMMREGVMESEEGRN